MEHVDPNPSPPRHPHHGRWSHACPHCRSTALRDLPAGALECCACNARLPPPSPHTLVPSEPTAYAFPRWEDDTRTPLWAYSRVVPSHDSAGWPGPLALVWGTSTIREDGTHPASGNRSEDRGPRVRTPARRGHADDALDASVRAYVDSTERLVALAHAIEEAARAENGEGAAKASAATPRPPRRRSFAAAVRTVVLAHVGEVLEQDGGSAPDDVARRATSSLTTLCHHGYAESSCRHAVPTWHAPLSLSSLGVIAAIYEVITNAIKDRGVEWEGTLDKVSPRPSRIEPFANVKHAIGVALGGDDPLLGGGSLRVGSAMATHALPQGAVFGGKMSVHPTRSGTSSAPGEDAVIEGVDVANAIRDAGLGALDLDLLALVDHGQGVAKQRKHGAGGASAPTIEPLRVDEAAEVLRGRGVKITTHQAKIRIASAREDLEKVLVTRGLIPVPKPRKTRVRTPSCDPFTIGEQK